MESGAQGEKVATHERRMNASGLTFDTGVLIALERRQQRAWNVYRLATSRKVRVTVPTAVIAEWWRGRSDVRDRIKTAITLIPFPVRAAEAAGVALGQIRGERDRAKLSVDVMVMAFAATLGGALVYTSDLDDLQKLTRYFPEVRLLGI